MQVLYILLLSLSSLYSSNVKRAKSAGDLNVKLRHNILLFVNDKKKQGGAVTNVSPTQFPVQFTAHPLWEPLGILTHLRVDLLLVVVV